MSRWPRPPSATNRSAEKQAETPAAAFPRVSQSAAWKLRSIEK